MKLSLLALAPTCFALSSSLSTNSGLTANDSPEPWVDYNFTVPSNSTVYGSELEKAQANWTMRNLHDCGHLCIAPNKVGGGWLKGFINYVGNAIYGQAHADFACNVQAGAYKEIKYSFKAYGGDCSTTAQKKTVKRGIEEYLKTLGGGHVCGMMCLKLDHGSTWNSYLLLGPVKTFKSDIYCGPGLDFSGCSSGGGADFN